MTLLVAIIGARRDNRWHSPFTRGYEHPVSRELRFERRDGEPFKDSWDKVWREQFKGDRADWLEAMTADGLLSEHLLLHRVDPPPHTAVLRQLVASQLAGLAERRELPPAQLGMCFYSHPCPFRSACPNWRMPSEQIGFLRIESLIPEGRDCR
jgi:hypothetical protein